MENVCCASLAGRGPGRAVGKLLCFECWSSALHILALPPPTGFAPPNWPSSGRAPACCSLSLDASLATTAKFTRTLHMLHEPDRNTRPCHCLHSRSNTLYLSLGLQPYSRSTVPTAEVLPF